MRPALFLLLLTSAAAATEYASSGCVCVTACARSIDSPLVPWCVTSYNAATNATATCGAYSTLRSAWWEACTVVTTSSTASGAEPLFFALTTFRSVWVYVTTTCVCVVSAAYAAAGVAAATRGASAPLRALAWAPAAAASVGAAHGLVVGAPFGAALAFLYMALPYPIDVSAAIALGAALGALAVFFAVDRDGPRLGALDRE